MPAIPISAPSARKPVLTLTSLKTLQHRILAFLTGRQAKRQQKLLEDLSIRQLIDIGVEPASVRKSGPHFVYLTPHLLLEPSLRERDDR